MLKGVLIGFFCFILFLIWHVLVFHFRGPFEKRFMVLRNIFFAIIPLYVLSYVLIPGELLVLMPAAPLTTSATVIAISKALNFMIGLMLYIFLFMCYGEFYFIIDRSLSVRISVELEKSSQKGLSFEELKNTYPPDGVYGRRFRHMVESGCIYEEGGYYMNTAKGSFLATVFRISLKLINVWPGG